MTAVTASQVYFIKLGRGGEWEAECLRDGILRLSYRKVPHGPCAQGDWEHVWQILKGSDGDAGATTHHVKQMRAFYEADEHSVFITFFGRYVYWCRPKGPVEPLDDGTRRRRTMDGWRNTSIGGTPLSTDRLSGHLLRVSGFQGTICVVKASDYLLRKLGDQLSPETVAAEEAERALLAAMVGLMRLLTWQDFELLVDLVFSASGWRRVSQVGGTQKTVDMELVLPSTGERAFVQVKSQATQASLDDYRSRMKQSQAYSRMFFVWHTGTIAEGDDQKGVTLLGPQRLPRMVLDAGLWSWLREKAS